MAANDIWPACHCGVIHVPGATPLSLYGHIYYPSWPVPAPSPRCPATTKHVSRYSTKATGLQCHYEPGHDGDHAGWAGPTEGDVFWPQEAEGEA